MVTEDRTLYSKTKKLGILSASQRISSSNNKDIWLFKSDKLAKEDRLISFRSINDLNDYSHDEIIFRIIKKEPDPDFYRSIISSAYLSTDNCLGQTDYWGMFPFFYYESVQTLIISDNLFLITKIIDAEFSLNAFYETLVFNKPKLLNTFFDGIYSTLPGQSFNYEIKSNKFCLGQSFDLFEKLTTTSEKKFVDEYNDIVNTAKKMNNIHLSLSSGSDSSTLLSGLLFNNIKPVCLTWGSVNYLEVQVLKSMINRLNLEWKIIPFNDLFTDYDNTNQRNMFITSGYNHTLHHAYYYSLNRGINLFEGYLGSEFIKGELSDGMYTPVMADIIIRNMSIKDALKLHFINLKPKIYVEFKDYIIDNFNEELINVNTDKGFMAYLKHFYSFGPSKIFSPISQLANYYNIKLYWPNLDPSFLRAVFSSGHGMKNQISIRNDFKEYTALKPIYELNRTFNSPLMKHKLDRNVSFADIGKPQIQFYLHKSFNRLFKKIRFIGKELIHHQVDYRSHLQFIQKHIKNGAPSWIYDKLSNNYDGLTSKDMRRTIVHFSMLQDIDNFDSNSLK